MYAPTFHDLSLTQFKSVSNTRFLIDAQFVAKMFCHIRYASF